MGKAIAAPPECFPLQQTGSRNDSRTGQRYKHNGTNRFRLAGRTQPQGEPGGVPCRGLAVPLMKSEGPCRCGSGCRRGSFSGLHLGGSRNRALRPAYGLGRRCKNPARVPGCGAFDPRHGGQVDDRLHPLAHSRGNPYRRDSASFSGPLGVEKELSWLKSKRKCLTRVTDAANLLHFLRKPKTNPEGHPSQQESGNRVGASIGSTFPHTIEGLSNNVSLMATTAHPPTG